jgi:threonine synthase
MLNEIFIINHKYNIINVLTAGFVARLMGVPVRFVCAVTQNDIVARAISKGDYSMSDNVIHTLAPAMDIQVLYFYKLLLESHVILYVF